VERFASALGPEQLQAFILTVAQGLFTMRERDAEGFTICPLVTREIRLDPFAPGPAPDVDIGACVAVVSFHAEAVSEGESWLKAHQDLCRAYYREVLAVFVERRLENLLGGRSFKQPWQVESIVVAGLAACLEELRTRLPLAPYQERCETFLRCASDPADAIRRIKRRMRAEASRRLGLSYRR